MNNYVFVGKIVNSFGIKGELKIRSDFEYKDRIFKNNFNIFIGNDKLKEVISSYRIHKGYDLITLVGYTNINEILKYKGENIYVLRDELKLEDNEFLLKDLVGLKVYDAGVLIGTVIDYECNGNNTLLRIKGNKTFYIPMVEAYIIDINIREKKIITNKGSELII